MFHSVVSIPEGSGTCLCHKTHAAQKPKQAFHRGPLSRVFQHRKVHRGIDQAGVGSCRGKNSTFCRAMAPATLLLPEGIKKEVEIVERDGVQCLIAKETISAGEEVLRVPQTLWITPKMACESEMGSLIANLEPWLQLALLLVQERAKTESGQGSDLEAYISTLRKSLGSPAFWSAEALESIQGTQLWQSSEGYR